MSEKYSFNVMPSVSISRSRFERVSQHKTTFNLGDIIPIYCDETLPGDTFSLDMASLVRMSTPIAPIMDNIYLDIFAFFVPGRIVWDHWKEFEGENKTSAGIPLITYHIPYLEVATGYNLGFNSGSYGDYFGLPVGPNIENNKISALPFRALAEIYNRWFRDENLIAPLAVQHGDTNEVIVGQLGNLGYPAFATSTTLLKASKLPDYFTKSLPFAQKGSAVTIPLGTGYVPVEFHNTSSTSAAAAEMIVSSLSGAAVPGGSSSLSGLATNGATGDLVVDAAKFGAASINQLRYAFQLQKLLEKDAAYGSRYYELLASHFGVKAADASIQDPEYLGGTRVNINIDQVLSTAGYQAGSSSTTVGGAGANSVTAQKGSLFTKSFTERGYVIVVAVARHDSTYGQGINRMWTRQDRFDFYWPVFANLGAQEVKNREIYAQGTSADMSNFGYQEAWAEYRYKPSICTGLLRPGVSGNLGFWTLAENFASLPTLGQTFIEQSRSNIQRALVTGSTGPDFVADFYFRNIAVRPMPVYSIPGLIDHH